MFISILLTRFNCFSIKEWHWVEDETEMQWKLLTWSRGYLLCGSNSMRTVRVLAELSQWGRGDRSIFFWRLSGTEFEQFSTNRFLASRSILCLKIFYLKSEHFCHSQRFYSRLKQFVCKTKASNKHAWFHLLFEREVIGFHLLKSIPVRIELPNKVSSHLFTNLATDVSLRNPNQSLLPSHEHIDFPGINFRKLLSFRFSFFSPHFVYRDQVSVSSMHCRRKTCKIYRTAGAKRM